MQDFGFRAGVYFEKKFEKKFDLIIGAEIRNFQNAKKIDDILLDTRLKYSINKEFSLGGNVRYIYDVKRVNGVEHNFRHSLDINYKRKIDKNISINYRLKHQKEFVNFHYRFKFWGGQQREFNTCIRNRLKLSYKHNRKNRFYGSVEFFKIFEAFRNPYFNKIRFVFGDEIKTQIGEFNVSIALEQEIGSQYPYQFVFLKTIYNIKK